MKTRLVENAVVPGTPYRLLERLGEGAFGEVWKALHPTRKKLYALKFCKNLEDLNTLRNEAKHLDRIPEDCRANFVALCEIHDEKRRDIPFVAYEYVEGGDFASFLKKRFKEQGPYAPEEAAEIIYELASIVGRVHTLTDPSTGLSQPLVHRDLKPENILLVQVGPPWKFKIADFGLGVLAISSSSADRLRVSDDGRQMRGGTFGYRSGEQNDRNHLGDPSDDVHALGVMWFELLKGDHFGSFGGHPPSYYQRYNWTPLREELLEIGLREKEVNLLLSCLKRHEFRPKNAAELARGLEGIYPSLKPKNKEGNLVEYYLNCARAELDKIRRATIGDHDFAFCIVSPLEPKCSGDPLEVSYAEAIANCSTAIRIDPKNPEGYRVRAEVYTEGVDYEKALADHDEIIRLYPNNPRSYLDRARLKLHLAIGVGPLDSEEEWPHNCEDAFSDYSKAIGLDPNNAELFQIRGLAFEAAQYHEEAIDDFTEAIRLNPTSVAYRHRGDSFISMCDYDKAIDDFTEAIRLAPTEGDAYLDRAEAYYYRDDDEDKVDFPKAIADCTTAIRLSPKNHRCYRKRGGIYECNGDYDKAIADYTAMIRLSSNSESGYKERAELYKRLKQFDKAIADYTEIIRLGKNRWYLTRAETYEMAGNYDAAISDYTHYLRLEGPEHESVYEARGKVYEKKRDFDKAIEDYSELIRLDGGTTRGTIRGYWLRADVYIKKGYYDKAIADYTTIIQMDPMVPAGYLRRADAYEKKGELRKANADRQTAAKLKA